MTDIAPIATTPAVLDPLSPSGQGRAGVQSATTDVEPPPSAEDPMLAELAAAMAGADPEQSPFDTSTSDTPPADADETDGDDDDTDENAEDESGDAPVVDAETSPPAETDAPDGGTVPAGQVAAPIDLNVVAKRFFGADLSEEQAVAFLKFSSDLDRMAREDPQRLYQINQILSGQPLQQPTQQQPTQQVPQPAAPPATPPTPTQNPAVPEYVDPDVAAAINPLVQSQQELQARLAQFEAYQQQQEYNRIQLENQNRAAQVNAAEAEWRASRPTISADEYVAFSAQMQQTLRSAPGLFPSFLDANHGDTAKATHALLDHFYWQDPTFREREIHAQVQQERTAAVDQKRRTSKSTALSGGGGGKAATQEREATPNTREAQVNKMADEIAELFAN